MDSSGQFLMWAGSSVVVTMLMFAAFSMTLDDKAETLRFAKSARVALYKPNHFVPYFYLPELIY